MDGVYERPVECRLCRGPVADGGAWMLELDVEKLRRWWRLALDTELDHDEETLDGLDSILTSCFCQFCLWDARYQAALKNWRDCDWWTGHDKNNLYEKYYFEKNLIQPCSARISISRRPRQKTFPPAKNFVKQFFPRSTVNSSEVTIYSSGLRGTSKKTTCIYCLENFPTKRAAHLHTQAVHNDKKLRYCHSCLEYFKSNDEADAHRAQLHSKIRCHLCKTYFLNSNDLRIHVFEKHILKDTSYQCCGKKFKNVHELFEHMTSIHLNFNAVCVYCKKSVSSTNLPRHIKYYHKHVSIQCEFSMCCEFFRTKKEREAHYSEAHKHRLLRKKITCVYCSQQLESKRIFGHVLKHHADVSIRCTYSKNCVAFFLTEEEREQHVLDAHKKPTISSKHKCIYCGVTLISLQSLHYHVYQRHRHENIVCNVRGCFRHFLSDADLEKHRIEQHAGMDINTFKCDQCKFSTNTDSKLREHVQNRHGVKNLKCPHCPKMFGGQQPLRNHICAVHGTKKMCAYCKELVRYHHTHIKVYPCKYCKETPKCRSLLMAHMKICDLKPLTKRQKQEMRKTKSGQS